jgi:phosphoglycolate phosphatase-like HAD superfamily hydrolase
VRKSTPRAARNPVDRRDQGDRQGGARSRFLVLWDIDGTLVQAGDVGRDIFTEAFQAVLGRAPDQVAARMLAMAGALGRSDGVVQSLLTGNVQPNALLKLASFELDGYLDFDVGGFGSDNRHRPSLVEVARAKAEGKYGTAFAGPATVLVGDTPLDVDAGRAGGARVVAVATGPYGVAELEATGADAVLADLRDTEAALAAILA